MHERPALTARAACVVALALLAGTAQAEARTWYVSASARGGERGTSTRPFGSLAAVERASRRGDTIVVLRSPPTAPPLDGGIALKPRQRLIGRGSARLTNTTAAHDGDAVVLADGVTVRNLEITGPRRGGVYGRDVRRVRIEDNEIWGHNSSCAEGFHIPPFIAPTNVPGAGIPISDGLSNGWAAIMVDASRRRGRIAISGNLVHDARCGDGIDIRLSGTARYRADVDRNVVRNLEEGPAFSSLLAIGLQTRDRSRLVASLDRNVQTELGNEGDPNLLVLGADTEGVFVNPVDASRMEVSLTRNTYTNPRGLGGFSSNGMEMVSMGDGSRARMVIRDSSFSGAPGDLLEQGALGTNARLELTLLDVVATRSVGFGNTALLPFNNSDCLLAGSLGAGNTVRLTVRGSTLTGCANNGLSVGSDVVNGDGPTSAIEVDVEGSEITGNRGANLGVRNFTELGSLSVRVQDTDLSDSRGLGSGVANVAVEDLGSTGSSIVDLGGGPLGSRGGNCLAGGSLAADVVRYDVRAERNWWGTPGGPGPGRTLAAGGTLDHEPALGASPCAPR